MRKKYIPPADSPKTGSWYRLQHFEWYQLERYSSEPSPAYIYLLPFGAIYYLISFSQISMPKNRIPLSEFIFIIGYLVG